MRYIQQNIFLPVKDTKTFILIDCNCVVRERVPQDRPEECKNELESSICSWIPYDCNSLEFHFEKTRVIH